MRSVSVLTTVLRNEVYSLNGLYDRLFLTAFTRSSDTRKKRGSARNKRKRMQIMIVGKLPYIIASVNPSENGFVD